MKRFRLRTLLLLVVLVALCLTVVAQQVRLARQQARLEMQALVIDELTQRMHGYNAMLAEKEYALQQAANDLTSQEAHER